MVISPFYSALAAEVAPHAGPLSGGEEESDCSGRQSAQGFLGKCHGEEPVELREAQDSSRHSNTSRLTRP